MEQVKRHHISIDGLNSTPHRPSFNKLGVLKKHNFEVAQNILSAFRVLYKLSNVFESSVEVLLLSLNRLLLFSKEEVN